MSLDAINYANQLVSQIQEIRTTLSSFNGTNIPDSVITIVVRKIDQIANAIEKIRNMFSSEYNAIAKVAKTQSLAQVPRISEMDGILANLINSINKSNNIVKTSKRNTKNIRNAMNKRLANLNSKVRKNKLQ